jgi:hypothetical protein
MQVTHELINKLALLLRHVQPLIFYSITDLRMINLSEKGSDHDRQKQHYHQELEQ